MDRLAFNGLGYRQPITTRLAASLGVILRRHILVTPPDTLPPCTRARANGVLLPTGHAVRAFLMIGAVCQI